MPRQTSRQATVREDVNLKSDRPVQLQAARRFFSSQGNDRATREARALQQAFGVGQQFIEDQNDRANVKGGQRAAADAVSGERDVNDKNFQYNKAWDEMDAERDLNLMNTELPELLRGADWENLEEEEVRGLISDYMANQFEGINPEGFYGLKLAPAMLVMELELISQHREQAVQKIQTEQRTTILENVKARFEASRLNGEVAQFDYQYLGEQTNIFFDGADKRKVYWESIFDFGIREGRPDIIIKTPARFGTDGKGDPTGINDPNFQDEIRAAINEATTRAAKIEKDRTDKFEAKSDADRFHAQMNIFRVGQLGMPVAALIRDLERIPGTKFTDVTASKGFADSQFAENEQQSPKFSVIGNIYADIHKNVGSAADQMAQVFQAAGIGDLGFGDTAVDNMNALVATIEKYQKNGAVLYNQEAGLYRTSLNTRYNDATGGLLKGINPLMQRVKIDANDMYNSLVLGGKSGREALDKVIKEFDPIVETFPQIEESEITGRRSQSDFTGSRISIGDITNAIETGSKDAFIGMSYYSIERRLADLSRSNELDVDTLHEFLTLYE